MRYTVRLTFRQALRALMTGQPLVLEPPQVVQQAVAMAGPWYCGTCGAQWARDNVTGRLVHPDPVCDISPPAA